MEFLPTLLIVCPLVFLAGFVDAIAGGGGLIALPAYLFAGLPAHTAVGCNKLSSCMGLVAASCKYFREKKVLLSVAFPWWRFFWPPARIWAPTRASR